MADAENSFEQLTHELGDYDAYQPDPYVSITADQLERFLRIRESMEDDRFRMEDVFCRF